MKILPFLCLFLYTSILFSQTPETEFGDWNKLERNTLPQKIIGADENVFYAVSWKNVRDKHPKSIKLERYEADEYTLDTVWNFEMPKVFDNKTIFENIFYIGGQLVLFTSANDQEIYKKVLYMQTINPDGSIVGNSKGIAEVSMYNKPEDGFELKFSDDKTKILIFYHDSYENLYDKEPFSVKVINDDLTETLGRALKFPLQDRRFKVIDYQVSKAGNIYFAIRAEKATKGKKKRKKRPSSKKKKKEVFDQIILAYNATNFKFSSFLISDTKASVQDLSFTVDKDENIHVFSLGMKKNGAGLIAVIYKKINMETEAIVKESYKNFSKDKKFIKEFSEPRNGENPLQYFNYTKGNVQILEEFGIVYIAENNFINYKSIEGRSGTSQKISYHNSNDIITSHVNTQGDLDWVTRIPKNQFSTDDDAYYSSFYVTNLYNKIKIIFNNHTKNLDVKNTSSLKKLKKQSNYKPFSSTRATIVTLFSDGSYEKYPLFNKDENFGISTRLIYQQKEKFIVFSQDGKKYSFVGFELDE